MRIYEKRNLGECGSKHRIAFRAFPQASRYVPTALETVSERAQQRVQRFFECKFLVIVAERKGRDAVPSTCAVAIRRQVDHQPPPSTRSFHSSIIFHHVGLIEKLVGLSCRPELVSEMEGEWIDASVAGGYDHWAFRTGVCQLRCVRCFLSLHGRG